MISRERGQSLFPSSQSERTRTLTNRPWDAITGDHRMTHILVARGPLTLVIENITQYTCFTKKKSIHNMHTTTYIT